MTRWYRGNDIEWHPDHPDRPPLERTANTAVHAANGELYTLYLLRWDNGAERFAALLSGCYSGMYGHKANGTWQLRDQPAYTMHDRMIDLVTGEEFEVASYDRDLAARKIGVKDLPPALREVWPKDEKGRWVRPGFYDDRDVMGQDVLRRIAGSVDAGPVQESLFGALL